MDRTSILESLATLELDTFEVMNELLTYRIDTPFTILIERARNEHKCRHDYISRRLIKTGAAHAASAIAEPDSASASGEKYPATDERVEPVEIADRAERRLSKIYKMATELLNMPQLIDLAREQESLCEEFREARRSITWKMRALPE